MVAEARWTLDELVRRVAATLAGPAYPGSPNGRVRDVPDRRTVRWYATIGLVDRPAAMQGRTALYSVRHLRQIVAVKRLQAQGLSLAEVQAELAGATDKTLRSVADISDEPVDGASAPPEPVARKRFWADRPARSAAVSDADADAADTVTSGPRSVCPAEPRCCCPADRASTMTCGDPSGRRAAP